MIKEQRKYCYGVYTLMFLLMCIVAFLPFFTEGKSFVWGAGVEGTPKTCDVGYESWVWCRYPLNIELLRNRWSVKPPLRICFAKEYRNYVWFHDLVTNVSGRDHVYHVCKKNEKTKLWNSDRGTGLCIQRILLSTRTAPSILHQSDDLFSAVMSWDWENLSERKTVCIYFRSLRISNEQLLFLIYADDICGDLCVDPFL